MKKITVILCTIFSLCIVSPVKAESASDMQHPVSFCSNEYQSLLNEYDRLSKEALVKPNTANVSQVTSLKASIESYPSYIYSLQSKSYEELKQFNYTDSQISAIKDYNGSEQMTIAASATVSGSVSLSSRSYNSSSNKTTARVTATVRWNGVPFVKSADTFSTALAGSSANFMRTSSSLRVVYPTSGTVYGSNYSVTLGAGVSYKFGIADASGVFSSATLTYDAIAEGNVTAIGFGAAYSHAVTSGLSSIGISIGVSGVGISFSANLGNDLMWQYASTRVY